MSQLHALLEQKAALDAQIAAAKPQAVQQVRDLMQSLGVTVDDLAPPRRAITSKRAVKYRDAAGNTWTGVGQRPRWLQAALGQGRTLEEFRVPPQQ